MNENQWQWVSGGRMLPDIDYLNLVAEEYKRNIYDLISLCQFKTIVFDFDGTLTEFKYDKEHLLPCKDDDINEYFLENNFYDKCHISRTMKLLLMMLDVRRTDPIYILTVSQPNVMAPKLECIKQHFPEIDESHIIQVTHSSMKMDELRKIHEATNQKILFIEDTAKTLLDAEETLDFVQGYHISSLIP